MKKLILFSLLCMSIAYAQKPEPIKLSPDGLLESIADNYGNTYGLSDILINKDGAFVDTSCDSGIFVLHFTTGSGMETSDPTHIARRAVVCQVFHDLSNFINTPLKNLGNTQRVHIWVRNFTDLFAANSGVQAFASGFYNYPVLPTAPTVDGGIIDNEVWKTIHTGVNSYTNVSTLITTSTDSSLFYHGMMGIDFTRDWNLNLTAPTFTNLDLYTVVLHEVSHALGFVSLVSDDGNSRLPNTNFYSRYDTFLENNLSQELITPADLANIMYNNNYNSSTLSNLHHCTTPAPSDPDNCTSEINFVGGASVIPVFNPICFINGSSLSHFEDSCFPVGSPYGNNSYFVMSNATPTSIPKRFPKPEESQTLAHIGYNLQNNYNGTMYSNLPDGINVAGINDGITNAAGTISYSYVVNVSTNLTTPTLLTITAANHILNNDFCGIAANLRYEGLQDVYHDQDGTTQITNTTGDINTPITFASTALGLHLLRYVPFDNVTGKRGNITYVYVMVQLTFNGATVFSGSIVNLCSNPEPCDLVINGDIEDHIPNLNPLVSVLSHSCNWITPLTTNNIRYCNSDNTGSFFGVPNNMYGNQQDNVVGNHGYAQASYGGIVTAGTPIITSSGNLITRLKTPLEANTFYRLTFDTSVCDNSIMNHMRFSAYMSNDFPLMINGMLTTPVLANLYPSDIITTSNTTFQRNTIIINAGSVTDLDVLTIGALVSNATIQNITGTTISALFYVDNVSIVPVESEINLPDQICINSTLNDLTVFLTPAPPGGTFSGVGVTGNSFNPSVAGLGQQVITYTYNNNLGCPVSLSDTIQIVNNGIVPVFPQTLSVCANSILPVLSTVSSNGITGTWNPSTISLAQTNYTFTPNPNQCAVNAALILIILPENDPSCSGNCPNTATLLVPDAQILYQRHEWIVASGNYAVANQNVTLKAGDFIDLFSNTDYNASTLTLFEAFIEDCCPTCRIVTENPKEETIIKSLDIFPNPTKGTFEILMKNSKFNNIIISSMDGKTIFSKSIESNYSYQIDISRYPQGMYIVTVTADDGQIFNEKIIKN